MNSEKIMVCVYYGPHGERLIKRGIQLAQMLDCPLIVLTVDPSEGSEVHLGRERYRTAWLALAKEAGAEFRVERCGGRKTAETIADVAREQEVTQIIIGQSGQTRWEEITKGSFVNDLMNEVGAVDLHIVAVSRIPDGHEETHESGVPAFLVPAEGGYELREEAEGSDVLPGIFFRELHTEFNNGLFKLEKDGAIRYLEVEEGRLAEPL